MTKPSKTRGTATILSLLLGTACLSKAFYDMGNNTPYAGAYGAFGALFLLDGLRRIYQRRSD